MADRGNSQGSGPGVPPALAPFAELLKQLPLAVIVVNRDGQVLMWNAEAERLFGWKSGEVIGRLPPQVTPDAIPKMFDLIHKAVEGNPAPGTEVIRMRRDGTRLNVLVHSGALRDRDGDVVGVIEMFVDVTERRQTEIRMRNAQKMEAVGLLAGGVAHDFNNLLTAIKGFSSLLLEAVGENEAASECVDEIVKAAERAAGLTGQLLAFSRRQLLRPEIIDLNARLREMHGMLRVLAASHIEVALELGEQVGMVMADPAQLQQVVLNLVTNARDAIVDRGRIVIRTGAQQLDAEFSRWGVTPRPGRYVRFDVVDTGTGMSPLTLSRAFDPFYTTREARTGLGLATVFGIVKQSGGYVWPTSTSEKGTTFSVYLPQYEPTEADLEALANAASHTGEPGHERRDGEAGPRAVTSTSRMPHSPTPPAAAGPTSPPVLRLVPGTPSKEARPGTRPLDAPRPAPSPRLTILLVDDDEAVRDMIRRGLERQRHTVLDAASGEQALQLNRMFNEPIDLLITDIRMPGMTGLELRDTLVTLRPGVHVLFISGHAEEFSRSELRDHQTPFLGKPFTMDQLDQAMQRAMASPPRG